MGGDDGLTGGIGCDVLEGGGRADTLNGGAGGDLFLFGADTGRARDRVVDLGADDFIVTTAALFDSDRNGRSSSHSRFSVSSRSSTGTPSRVRRTSNSTASAPWSSAERSEASVFSRKRYGSPRWATAVSVCMGPL